MTYQAKNSANKKGDNTNESLNSQAENKKNNNNAKRVKNVADAAIASKNPYGVAAGLGIKAADKITGGKASNLIGKGMDLSNRLNNINNFNKFPSPKVNFMQNNNSNRPGDSGATNTNTGNTTSGSGTSQPSSDNNNQVKNNGASGGGRQSSLPSSLGSSFFNRMSKKKPFGDNDENDDGDKQDNNTNNISFIFSPIVKIGILILAPCLLVVLIMVLAVSLVSGVFGIFEDGFGISNLIGDETGEVEFYASDEQQNFYDRINSVKARYQAQGKTLNPLAVVAVYQTLNDNGAGLDYNDMSESDIETIANYMFDGNMYSEDAFKSNLVNYLIPNYLPNSSDDKREIIADNILEYVSSYYDIVGKEDGFTYTCSSDGTCTYNIKGFYIQGKGNVSKNIQVKDLYVRLMQCGVASGHNYGGIFGQPLEGEELVPFEKYILGVAYQEIGESVPAEAFKAQMIAARSYILARPTDMGGWRSLKQESDGKWVLQAAACTQDQVYCDPDKGCSSNNGQWGQVHSGLNYNSGFSRKPLSTNSPLRTYAQETKGEVLVNDQGYIVYSAYTSNESNAFKSLANSGLNYKQILLQVYNQGRRNYKAKNIEKASCGGSSSNCSVSTGEFARWKQYEGPWVNVVLGSSGSTIGQIGCLATSVAIQIAKSGVPTVISSFDPGTFVKYLSGHGGFDSFGNFNWASASNVAPTFQYQGSIGVAGYSREQKLNTLRNLLSQNGVYVVAEVKGNTGQHWVAVDSISGNTINMMDPGSSSTDMWAQYPWNNTSVFAYYKVVR